MGREAHLLVKVYPGWSKETKQSVREKERKRERERERERERWEIIKKQGKYKA